MLRHLLPCALLLLALTGCNDTGDPVEPAANPHPVLEGQVVDHLGVPAEGVAIGLVYELDPVLPRAREGLTTLHFSLADTALVELIIVDFRGRYVSALFDGMLPEGTHSAAWPGTDDEGTFVPNGAYVARLAITVGEEILRLEQRLFFQLSDPEGLAERPQTVSGPDGRFEIPLEELPLGETIPLTDLEGTLLGEHVVSNMVEVWAVQVDKSGLVADDVLVGLRQEGSNRVLLRLPAPDGLFP